MMGLVSVKSNVYLYQQYNEWHWLLCHLPVIHSLWPLSNSERHTMSCSWKEYRNFFTHSWRRQLSFLQLFIFQDCVIPPSWYCSFCWWAAGICYPWGWNQTPSDPSSALSVTCWSHPKWSHSLSHLTTFWGWWTAVSSSLETAFTGFGAAPLVTWFLGQSTNLVFFLGCPLLGQYPVKISVPPWRRHLSVEEV